MLKMFSEKQILLIPGPTPVPPRVLRAMMRPMMNHRSREYESFLLRLTDRLKQVFQTQHDVLIFPSAGTGAMEAAIVNFFSPGDVVLAISIGYFGDRFAEIAARFGMNVTTLSFEWGKAADLDGVQKALASKPFKAVLLTHNETSTGVTNPVREIAQLVRAQGALLLVDAVSSLAAIDLPMDAWGIDVVVAGSQKGLMTPPGLGLVAFNERAKAAMETARCPRYYWDFELALKYLARGQNPYTPALPLLFALDEALTMLFEEGLPNVFARHEKLKQMVRKGAREMGLGLLAEDDFASNTVTALVMPDGINADWVRQQLERDFAVIVAGGQEHLKGKILRIGHVGWVSSADVGFALSALRQIVRGY